MLAALRRQPVDRIPFVPLIDVYTVRDMPSEIAGRRPMLLYDVPGLIAASRALGCDLMLRHVPVTEPPSSFAPHLQSLGPFAPPIQVKAELGGRELIETLITPVGTLTGTWGFTDSVGWIPHPVQHLVNSYEEMKIFHYAVEHLSSEPPAADPDFFLQMEAEIGDDGIATASLPNTPLMYLIETVWGLENTHYLLYDHREEVEDILEKLHASLRQLAEQIAASPAQVVIQYENTSSTLLSPAVFRRYCLPYLNEYAEILKGAGKVFLVHMCGKVRSFVDDFGPARFAGIADIAPPPTGDLSLDEAAARLPGKVVMGGIDATTFVSQDSEYVEAEISRLIERIKPLRGVLLGSGDTTPRGTPVENFRLIRRLVDTLGTYV